MIGDWGVFGDWGLIWGLIWGLMRRLRARGLRCERRRRDAAGLWAVRRAAVPATDAPKNKFAGLFRDEESGLDHARARIYESRTGRFTRLHGRNIREAAMPGLGRVGFHAVSSWVSRREVSPIGFGRAMLDCRTPRGFK